MLCRLLFALMLCTSGSRVYAWPEWYGTAAYGGALLTLNQPEEEMEDRSRSITTEVVMAGGGVEWLPGLSTGLSLWIWGDKAVNDRTEDQQMDGISSSWDVRLRLPLGDGSGPYVRYGRQCWRVVISGLEQGWSEDGCALMKSIGVSLTTGSSTQYSTQYPQAALTLEYMKTEFNEVDVAVLSAGFHASF